MPIAKKSLLWLALLAVFCFIIFWLSWQAISNLIDQRNIIQNELSRITKGYLAQPAAEKKLREIKAGEKDIEEISGKALIAAGSELAFIQFLESLSDHNIDQKFRFSFDKKIKPNGGYEKIPLEIILQSDFHQLLQYLYNLEKSDYYFEINNIKIDNLGNADETISNLKTTLNGYIYSTPPK